jgi:hypothetical protein
VKKYRGTVMVDLDGVLFDFAGRFREWLSGKHFRDYNEPKTWHFYKEWGLEEGEFVNLLKAFALNRGFLQPPMPGATAFVNGLMALGLKVVFCTHRFQEAAADTQQWAQFYFPDVEVVRIISDQSTKLVFRDDGPAPYFAVDDKIETVDELGRAGVFAYLFDQQWNQEPEFGSYSTGRVLSYQSAIDQIESRLLAIENESGVTQSRKLEASRNVVKSKAREKVEEHRGSCCEPVQEVAFQLPAEGTETGPFVFEDGKWRWKVNGDPLSDDVRINVQAHTNKEMHFQSEEVTYTDPTTGGRKGAKPERFDLLPTRPLAIVARHYGIGADKYGDRNWEKGYPWSLTYAAMQRHLNAFWSGEDIDQETQSPHLAAVVFHALALMEFMNTHPEMDDRNKEGK